MRASKRWAGWVGLAGLVVVLLGGCRSEMASSGAGAGAGGWQRYRAPCGFSVEAPGEPSVEVIGVEARTWGTSVTMDFAWMSAAGEAMGVTCRRLGFEHALLTSAQREAREDRLLLVGVEEIGEADGHAVIDLKDLDAPDELVGNEVAARWIPAQGKEQQALIQLWISGRHAWEVAAYSKGAEVGEDARRFVSSFRIEPDGRGAPKPADAELAPGVEGPRWERWKGPDGAFYVDMPTAPRRSTKVQQTETGPLVYDAWTSNGFTLWRSPPLAPLKDVDLATDHTARALLLGKDDVTTLENPTRVAARWLNNNGTIGRDWTIRGTMPGTEKVALARVRKWVVGQQIYQLMALRPIEAASTNVDRFVGSFKLVAGRR